MAEKQKRKIRMSYLGGFLLAIFFFCLVGCSKEVMYKPVFEGVRDIYIVRGNTADYEGDVQAFDADGEEITGDIQIDASQVVLDECGEYTLIYRIEDDEGNRAEAGCKVYVVEGEAAVPIILKEQESAFLRISHENGGEIIKGSGFIVEITEEAVYAMTNAHVVGEQEEVELYFYEGSNARGRVLARKEEPDMAVVRVEAESLAPKLLERIRAVEMEIGYWDNLDPQALPAAGYRCMNTDGSLWIEEVGRLLEKQKTTWISQYPLVQYTMENKNGASGSAVIDESGRLIAMALGVSEEENTRAFWGIGLPDLLVFYEEATGRRPGY